MPAKGNLFDEDSETEAEPLSEPETERYHRATTKQLFSSKRVRLDVDLAISFLCTKVAKPSKGDLEKLKRVLEYLKHTKNMKSTMSMNNMVYLQTWIDASYATHRDMRGHTGGVISMGKGMVIHGCSKQKINTKSSTESEIVGVSNFLTSCLILYVQIQKYPNYPLTTFFKFLLTLYFFPNIYFGGTYYFF